MTTRRPRTSVCSECGGRMSLIDCGVPEHHRTRTPAERRDGRCPGRVYAHDDNGGIDCEGSIG